METGISEEELLLKVRTYLEESWLYYIVYGDNNISDMEYDCLCKEILDSFENLPDIAKGLLSKDSLQAGTGYDISIPTYKKAFHLGLLRHEVVGII